MTKKPFKISAEALEELRSTIASLRPKPKTEFSAREMLVEIEGVIRDAMAIGYDLTDIAKMVAALGHNINPGTLSTYLRELQVKPQGKKYQLKPKGVAADPKPNTVPPPNSAVAPTTLKEIAKPSDAKAGPSQAEAELNQKIDKMMYTLES